MEEMKESMENEKEMETADIEETIQEAAAEEVVDSQKQAAEKKDKKRDKKRSSKSLEIELEKKENEIDQLKDKYQRLMAEFENARKRTQKESTRMYDIGAKEVLAKLLPVVDNFERGLSGVGEEEKENAFVQGVDAIYKQLMTALEEIGVKPMNAEGTEFNPDLHNAVMHVEDEELGENLVAEEFQKGYMYKEEVLRHSMVKVVN